MAKIQLQAYEVANWQDSTATRLRIFCNHAFTASTDEYIPVGTVDGQLGEAYLSLTCTYDSNTSTLTIPQFIIDSTTDGIDYKLSRYTAALFDSSGNFKRLLQNFESFVVPPTLASTSGCTPSGGATSCGTWAEVNLYNSGSPPLPIDSYYNKDQINYLLDSLSGIQADQITAGEGIEVEESGTDVVITSKGGVRAVVSGVNMNTHFKQPLYTVPSGKNLIVTNVYIVNPSINVSATEYHAGYDSDAFDLIEVSWTGIWLGPDAGDSKGLPFWDIIPPHIRVGTAGQVLGIAGTFGSLPGEPATATIIVEGVLIDE